MSPCRGCAAEIPEGSRFCPHCGVPAGGPILVTATIASAKPARPDPRTSSEFISSSSVDEGRFLPGTLLSDRYRIIGPLGKGGMGEVYRATDIRLGQTVALKFLPEEAAQDPGKLARFHNEVRIARQVTHPNVCRVYDIGEVDGMPFLSMEFVDGEDLALLLRRIGRLPQDKAIEIARKLCAGLSAAHSQGVLHRDLKPANIMIDGRGQVVITDFGLAGLSAELQNTDIRSGTPAYMAPEQLSGKEVSVQSDLYSLGLVLYEIFTGKKAFEASTLAEMIRLREQGPPSVTSLVREIDPAVEGAIVRCLDPDPRKRPPSALAISAALPGGDPLAAALAAGETPSPEMVAAAGATEGMRPVAAVACLAAIVVGMLSLVAIFSDELITGKTRLEMPPDALAYEAHRIVQRLGYTATPGDRAWGFEYASDYLEYLDSHKNAKRDWTKIANSQPAPITLWYRESPRPLTAEGTDEPGAVSLADPPQRTSGMVSVIVDTAGRLVELEAVPPQVEPRAVAARPLDPAPLFAAAGLDLAQFKPAEPGWTPPQMADARAAWTGTFPGRPENPIRVEAASWRGKPVYFQIIGPWTQPSRMQPERASRSQRANQLLWISLFTVLVIVGSLLAWRNLRLGRGDRQGAFRIAALSFGLSLGIWIFGAHHVPWPGEAGLFANAVAQSLLAGALLWVAYIALEPFVRRHWPATIIAWTRTLGGGIRDPLVGRDVMIGLLVGIGYELVIAGGIAIDRSMGNDRPGANTQLSMLLGFPHFTSGYLNHARDALVGSLLLFMVFFLLRVLLRREWLAAAAFVALFSARGLASDTPLVETGIYVVIYGILVALLLRYGFLAVLVCIFVTDLLIQVFFTTDLTAWYGIPSLLTLLSLIGLALFAYRASTAGKPLFAGLLDR